MGFHIVASVDSWQTVARVTVFFPAEQYHGTKPHAAAMMTFRQEGELAARNPTRFQLGYRPGLDGLRACAILIVMAGHAWFPDIRAVNSMALFIGVDLFFVLSGFLITSLLLEEWSDFGRISLKLFYIRRALRLLPALLAVIIVSILFHWLMVSRAAAVDVAIDGVIALFYSANWAQALEMGRPHMLLSHTWSLSIEEQFYLLWPITLIFLLKRAGKSPRSLLNWLLLLVFLSVVDRVLLVAAGAGFERIRCGTDTRADSLLLGCALAAALWSGWRPARTWIRYLVTFAAWLSVFALGILSCDNRCTLPFAQYWLYPAVTIFAALIILGLVVAPVGSLNRLLSQPWLVYIGRVSYGLYLWHIPVFRVIHARFWPRVWEVVIELVVSFALSLLSFYFVEKRALRLKKKFRKEPGLPQEFVPSTRKA